MLVDSTGLGREETIMLPARVTEQPRMMRTPTATSYTYTRRSVDAMTVSRSAELGEFLLSDQHESLLIGRGFSHAHLQVSSFAFQGSSAPIAQLVGHLTHT